MIAPDENSIPADVLSDMQAVADALASRTLVAPEVARRILERSENAQADLLREHGVREIAVDLIRAIRDEE